MLLEALNRPNSDASAEATMLKPPTMSTLPSTVLFDVELVEAEETPWLSKERPSCTKLPRLRLIDASAIPSRLLTPKEI